jgi:hypothetical protein
MVGVGGSIDRLRGRNFRWPSVVLAMALMDGWKESYKK